MIIYMMAIPIHIMIILILIVILKIRCTEKMIWMIIDGYGRYNEYSEYNRGYYYHDGRYERKTSPMMSPIISIG